MGAELVAASAVRPDRVVTVSEFGQYAPSLSSQHPLGCQVKSPLTFLSLPTCTLLDSACNILTMAVNPPKAATAFETYLFAPVDLWNGLDIEVSQQAQTQSSHKHPLHTRVLEYLTTRDDTQTLNFSLFDSMCGIPHAASICLPDIPPEHGGPSLEEFARELKPYLQNFPLQVRKFVGKIAGIAAFRQCKFHLAS